MKKKFTSCRVIMGLIFNLIFSIHLLLSPLPILVITTGPLITLNTSEAAVPFAGYLLKKGVEKAIKAKAGNVSKKAVTILLKKIKNPKTVEKAIEFSKIFARKNPKLARSALRLIEDLRKKNLTLLQPRKIAELTSIFRKNARVKGIQIGKRTLLPDTKNKGKAQIFNGVSEREIKQYFAELTGKPLKKASVLDIPNKGRVYYTDTKYGRFNLRNFSFSENKTGAKWTIDIPNTAIGLGKEGKKEIKFR